jgi:hypothetical protein
MTLPVTPAESNEQVPAKQNGELPVANLGNIADALKTLFPEMETVKDALITNLQDLKDEKVKVEVSNQINITANNVMQTVTAKLKAVDLLTRGKR